MPCDKETVIRSMVLKQHPDFNLVFKEDPLFAFIFMPVSFDTQLSLIFCTNSRSRAKEVSIEKVELDYMQSVKYLTTPTQSLLEQLQTVKKMLNPKTTALQFSEICRELIVAKSKYKFSRWHGGEKKREGGEKKSGDDDDYDKYYSDQRAALESFDIRCYDLFIEKDFHRLVGILSNFITSASDGITWVKKEGIYTTNGPPKIFFKPAEDFELVLLWVRDDDYIIAIKMPKQENNHPGSEFLAEDEESTASRDMEIRTWNEMFGSIRSARCHNAGVIFLTLNDRIRYVCARNVNMFDSDWESGGNLPVIWCEPDSDLQYVWRETKICQRIRGLEEPYIADGNGLRDMVEDTAENLADGWKQEHPKLLIYLCLSVFFMKNWYNYRRRVDFRFFCERCMFEGNDGMIRVMRAWTAYILGQNKSYQYKEKYKGSEDSIICFDVHKVLVRGTLRRRQISWQFIPEKPWVEVIDSLRGLLPADLPKEDMPGNRTDLR